MRLIYALAAVAALFVTPVQALDCSGGRYIADAEVAPTAAMGRIMRATQFAWDGGSRIMFACNLTNGGSRDFEQYWNIYAREFSAEFAGLCLMLTGVDGRAWYSCATATAVERARNATRGSRDFSLRFSEWQPGLRANVTR
ncbi:hypothetical protein [Pararhodobacter zhoushanensis]|uniref:Uncharacterized protein n=1 Tax=Pararhodobacter zhoushanensis TaxID=2479545 RepID=A0ABT3GXE2_9RHOB|nr:hypothetical protein [Pararhodobacter zhoushanensis]MCW1932182.1 hypothetical protein [Pararhodobacter zhoushanensis]